MKTNAASAFRLACVYTGAVLGAGFASGQEIWRFFGRFGWWGFWGMCLTILFFAFVGCGMFLKIYRLALSSYTEFCGELFGKRAGKFFSFFGNCYMGATFCIMLSGSGALFQQELHLPYFAGTASMAAVCFFVFLFGIRGTVVANTFLTPIMVLGMVALGAYKLLFGDHAVMNALNELVYVNNNWLLSALVYISYNLISIPAVVCGMKKYMTNSATAIWGGLLGSIFIGLCGLSIYYVSLYPDFYLSQMPALTFAAFMGNHFKLFYGLTIYIAMLTTAISCGQGVLGLAPKGKRLHCNILLCGSCCVLALLGFSNLVNYLYSFFGYIGLLITVIVCKECLKEFKIQRIL